MKRFFCLLLILAGGCATFYQAEDIRKRQAETDRKLQEVLDTNIRGRCTLTLCEERIVVNNATEYECRNLGVLFTTMEKRIPDLCNHSQQRMVPGNSRAPVVLR